MKVAIIGSEAAKFTPDTERKAKDLIREILAYDEVTAVVSGACHLGGIDIWAEEIADDLRLRKLIFPPRHFRWSGGYRERNLKIARACDVAHCLTLAVLPAAYAGRRFPAGCYHCRDHRPLHVKSGACWTVLKAQTFGKPGFWHIL